MSYTETHFGKCELLFKGTPEEIETFCKKKAASLSLYLNDVYENYTELIIEQLYDDWCFIKDKIYVIKEDNSFSDGDIFKATKNTNGEIEYVLQYYNSRCSFGEALEEALENMENK